jgi:ankyrin repeat protein
VDLARFLIEHGADVTAQDNNGSTPLHQLSGSNSGNVELATFFVEHGADVTAQDKNRSTPLHKVLELRRGNVDLARFLVEHGAEVTAQDKDGSTPLGLASASGITELADILATALPNPKAGRLSSVWRRLQKVWEEFFVGLR